MLIKTTWISYPNLQRSPSTVFRVVGSAALIVHYSWLQSCVLKQLSFPGKSSLAIQFVQGQFVDHYEPTIENSNPQILIQCACVCLSWDFTLRAFPYLSNGTQITISSSEIVDLPCKDSAWKMVANIFFSPFYVIVSALCLIYQWCLKF